MRPAMNQPALFDPRTTIPPRCAYCETSRPNLCQWAADREQGGELQGKTKPKTCLLRHDPGKAPIPF